MRWLTTTVLPLLLLNSLSLLGCATQVPNFTGCALIPLVSNGVLSPAGSGAVCDDFLDSNPQDLTESQWEAMELEWEKDGKAVECVTSDDIGNIKATIEKLCSQVPCDYVTQATVIDGLNRIQSLRRLVLNRSPQLTQAQSQ